MEGRERQSKRERVKDSTCREGETERVGVEKQKRKKWVNCVCGRQRDLRSG